MDERDASGGTSWNLGDPFLPDGVVQGSVDDPSFANPVTATLTNYPGKRWSLDVSVAGLSSGTHALYVRQVEGGFAGKAASAPFTVP
jgi:hypothetical protein